MTRNEFRRRFIPKNIRFFESSLPSLPSETDPTFALTGLQMFLASMRGEALPTPPIVQEFTGVHADELSLLDNPMADRFQFIDEARKYLKDTDNKVLTLKKQLDNEKV